MSKANEPNPGSDEAIDEEFRPIEGYEERYEISNYGRVKSLHYYGKEGNVGFLTPRWNTSDRNNGRYASVRLINSEKNKDKSYRIHRLVAEAFIPNPDNKSEVNHVDGDTENNKVTNLEWATRSENQIHAIENDLADAPETPNPKGSGEKYAWENDDGRAFFGTPIQLEREYPNDKMDVGYLYKIVNDDYPHHKSHKNWTDIEVPKPGSDKAIEMGGRCPILDNSHGRGYYGNGEQFVYNADCEVHEHDYE